MAGAALLYDRVRVGALTSRTAAAIGWLDGRSSDEPATADAIARLRWVSFTLSTRWMPYLTRLLGDTSMLEWDGAVPQSMAAGPVHGAAGASAGSPGTHRNGVLTDPDYVLRGNVSAGPPAAVAPELNPDCVDLGDAAPAGGGYVTGPDGRDYPIVIGAEPPGTGDWEVVGYQSGVERFQSEPTPIERFWAFWAGTTGRVQAPPPNEALSFVAMAPGRLPYLSETPWTPGPIERVRSAGVPDPADSSASSAIPASLGLVITAGQGVSFAASLDHQRCRAYQAVFEEDSRGRRRARIETFTLTAGDVGEPVIVPENVFVGPEGRLMSRDITYPPERAPGSDVWAPAFDQDREITPRPIPGATLP